MSINALNVLNVKSIETLEVAEATKHRIAAFAFSKGWKPYANDAEDFYVPHAELIANLLLEEEFRADAVQYIKQLLKYGSHHVSEVANRLQDAILQSWEEEKEFSSFKDEEDVLVVTLPRKTAAVNTIDGHFSTVVSHGNLVLLSEGGSAHNVVMCEAGGVLLSKNLGGNMLRACGFSNLYIVASNNDAIFVDGATTAIVTGDSTTVKVVDGSSTTFLTGKDVNIVVDIEDPVEGIDDGAIIATEGFGVININSPIPRLEVNDRYDVFFEGNRINLPEGAIYYTLTYNYDDGKYNVEVVY